MCVQKFSLVQFIEHLTYGVLVLVRVDASIHDSSKQVIHNASQRFSVQHAMQGTDKHSFAGVQTLGRATHVVAVRDHPRDDLHLKQEDRTTVTVHIS